MKGVPVPSIDLDNLTIDEVFDAFKHIQALTDTQDAVTLATYLTLKEFSEENVKYIELRSTPRSEWYGKAVLEGIKKANFEFDIIARYLPSIDRSRSFDHVTSVLKMALTLDRDLTIGIDVSGDPKCNDQNDAIIRGLYFYK